ncbi:MAG: biotin--[acetyl-CoA-carboxylase] ligase [Bacteroidetes bacterium GWF2_40_14]|nr:MAG: biotin--[acetyl-CoA-carboxylase] ligase [Bacteroidetes bacterium GWF2_40_14]
MALEIKWFDTIDSTNNEAFRQIESAQDFTIYAAKFQTSGRGQKGNSWESALGKNLTFSILIKPVLLKATDQFLVSQIVALGILRYLEGFGIKAKIKWPNDIYVENSKICGILIEHYLSGANLSVSILGIGLNLNQSEFASDAPNPTSLLLETGEEHMPEKELLAIISPIKEYYDKLNVKAYKAFKEVTEKLYTESLYKFGEFSLYQETSTQEIFVARITGIDKNACLVLEKRDGSNKSYAFKEIRYILNH